MQGAWVWSLVRGLRSHVLYNKKIRKTKTLSVLVLYWVGRKVHSLGFSCKMLWKNPNELFSQPKYPNQSFWFFLVSFAFVYHFMGNRWGNSVKLYFLASKITADGDCSHQIKWCLLLGRKVMTNLDSILKSKDITLPTKVHLVKTMVFPVVMYGCESWTVKKAEHRRIDTFELWCWRRLLRVPWTSRRSNQSILEISPGCSLEGLMLKLKPQYFGHIMQRVDSLEKTLMLGGIGGRRRRGWQRMVEWHHWLDGHELE